MLPLLLATGIALAGIPVELGAPARAFSLPVLNVDDHAQNNRVSLYDYTGVGAPDPHEAVVLFFFEPGAGDALLPDLDRFARKHDDVAVLGVLSDSRGTNAATSLVRAAAPGFPVLYDQHRVVFRRYDVAEVPLTFIIDADGYVHAAGKPRADSFQRDLDAVLAPLIED
ncbi:MAG: TlpA family protein disulfide reductase [Deltaproteobacteria bacterium]|nr:MAG: TlpA family protein disulfide reductase [Deltaproteobacteria bacterium]